MQQPEFYLGRIAEKMDGQGNIQDPGTQDFIDQFWTAFSKWIKKFI